MEQTSQPIVPDDPALDWTPVLDLKPWEQHLDVPGWPEGDLDSIHGG